MINVYWTCKCGHEHEVCVTINEEDDLPEKCEGCGEDVPEKAHEDVHTWAIEKANDSADYDRN